ncbi:hypothetical protein R1sor_004020 [Riccia sorocarpa]|uniref:ASCH domain-containing protein n=1 Tax=Riccia sorocarpa TaxID=122646 RepID=A0ABD3H3B3_9MARC
MATETVAPIPASELEVDTSSVVSQETVYPPSPQSPPLSFAEFMTCALKSLLSGENQLPCPLPPDFCAALLRTDDSGGETAGQEVFSAKGLPQYPLYKYIGHGLSEWISSGSFPRSVEALEGIAEDEAKAAKIDRWTLRVVDLGAYLMEVYREVRFQLHCQEPFFSQLKDGKKTVEGRCAGGYYSKLQVGDGLLFNGVLFLQVKDVKKYNTFRKMMETEGLDNVLPGVSSVIEGVQVYRNFYSEAKERESGVLGIHVRHPLNQRQPFELLYDLLKELEVEGIRALLGMRTTMGSIPDALPPPTSALLSSFSEVNNETVSFLLDSPCPLLVHHSYRYCCGAMEVPGSKLTVGARALAKHVHRCSNGWWGTFSGTEPAKNEVSRRKLRRMIEDAVWMNVHVVPVPVFEIRVAAGYGARWSQDGRTFRGFLEPPMEEGYLHKWRH